MTMAETIIVQ